MEKQLALHETLELHELLTFKNLSVAKTSLMASVVRDQELKSIFIQDAKNGERAVKQLEAFIENQEGR